MRKIDKAYEFIKKYIEEKDYPPTIREIANALDIKSTSTVAYYLRRLEEANKIVKGSYKNRSIQLMETYIAKAKSTEIIAMPLIKSVTPGQSLKNELNISDKYMFSSDLFNGIDMFMMEVPDDNMKNSGIFAGDKVIVSRQNVARNGELVIALVNGRHQVAKLCREYGLFKLQYDNKDVDSIFLEKIVILGKVVGVIRTQID